MLNFKRQGGRSRSGLVKCCFGFVAVYLLLMLLWVPVAWFYPQVKSQPSLKQPLASFQLPEIKRLSGNLWRGVAQEIALPVSQPLRLRSLAWQWQPSALLKAAFGYRFSLAESQNQAQLAVAWDRSLIIKDLQLSGSLSEWVSSFQGQPLPLNVDLSASLTQGRIGLQGCSALVQGKLSLQNWQGLMAETLNRIGRIDANLDCIDGKMQLLFKGEAKEVQLSGRWLLDLEQGYALTIEARPQTADIQDRLGAVGFVERSAGVWQLSRQGRL